MKLHLSFAWMGGSQVGTFLLQFGGTMLLARLLSPLQMGVYAAASSLVGVLALVQAFGLTMMVVREEVLSEELIRTVFTINCITSVVAASIIFVIGSTETTILSQSEFGETIILMCLVPLLGAFEFLPLALAERNGNFRIIAVVNFLKVLGGMVTSVTFAFFGFSSMSIAAGGICSAAIGACCGIFLRRRSVRPRFHLGGWRKVTRFAVEQFSIQGVNNLSSRASELALAQQLGFSSLGLYTRASQLNNMIWTNIHLIVGRIVLVGLANESRLNSDLRAAYLKTVELMTGLLWPGFVGLALLSRPVIHLVFGPEWVAAALPLSILCAASVLLVGITMTFELFVVAGRTGEQARIETVRSIFAFLLFLGASRMGLMYAAASRLVEAAVSVFVYKKYIYEMTNTSRMDFQGIYIRSGALTFIAVMPALICMQMANWSSDLPLSTLCLTIFSSLIAWLMGSLVVRHAFRSEMVNLLGERRRLSLRSIWS